MSLRILHVLDHSIPLHSGYAFRTRAIIDGQRDLGWETIHLTGPKQGACSGELEAVEGLEFHRTPPMNPMQRTPLLGHAQVMHAIERRLDEVVRESAPDIIHAHSPALNGWAALRVARRTRLPCVYEVRAFWEDAAVDHGTTHEGSLRYRLTRALETRIMKRVDAVTCICEGLRSEIASRGIDAGRIHVIPNAVDADKFTVDPARDEALASDLRIGNAPVIGFVGSFYAYEGLDTAIRALSVLRAAGSDTRLLLVGGGPQEDNLQRLAADLGLEQHVIFAGRIPHHDVQRYYGLMNLLVYPRRPMRLTELVTPLKPLEAMAQGRAVLASDVGGHRELIEDGRNGVLFPPDDPGALAEAVMSLLEDSAGAARLAEAGRSYVESERTWPRSVAVYRSVYAALATAGEPEPESRHV